MNQQLFADLGIVNPRTTFSAETAVDMIKAATLIVQTHPGTLGGEPAAIVGVAQVIATVYLAQVNASKSG